MAAKKGGKKLKSSKKLSATRPLSGKWIKID